MGIISKLTSSTKPLQHSNYDGNELIEFEPIILPIWPQYFPNNSTRILGSAKAKTKAKAKEIIVHSYFVALCKLKPYDQGRLL